MKLPSEQQGQTCTPSSPTTLDDKQPILAPAKSNWQRYLDGDWNPMIKQPKSTKDSTVKCSY